MKFTKLLTYRRPDMSPFLTRIRRTAAAGLLTLAVAATVAAEPAIELKMNLAPGDTVVQRLDIDQDIDQVMFGQNIQMQQFIGMTLRTQFLDRPSEAGGVWAAITYDRVQFKQTGPQGNLDYDSADPPDPVPMGARAFTGMVGRTLQVEYHADGRVVQIEGIDAMMQAMVEALDLPEGPSREALETAMKSQMNPDTLKQMINMASGFYPDRPVARGESWDDRQKVAGMMPMTIDTTYTLKDYDEQHATLDLVGKIGPNPDAQAPVVNGAELDAEMNGTQTGQTLINRKTGWPIRSSIDQNMVGGITVVAPDGNSFEIDMTITGTVKMTTLEN
jgi:hypothetical protein